MPHHFSTRPQEKRHGPDAKKPFRMSNGHYGESGRKSFLRQVQAAHWHERAQNSAFKQEKSALKVNVNARFKGKSEFCSAAEFFSGQDPKQDSEYRVACELFRKVFSAAALESFEVASHLSMSSLRTVFTTDSDRDIRIEDAGPNLAVVRDREGSTVPCFVHLLLKVRNPISGYTKELVLVRWLEFDLSVTIAGFTGVCVTSDWSLISSKHIERRMDYFPDLGSSSRFFVRNPFGDVEQLKALIDSFSFTEYEKEEMKEFMPPSWPLQQALPETGLILPDLFHARAFTAASAPPQQQIQTRSSQVMTSTKLAFAPRRVGGINLTAPDFDSIHTGLSEKALEGYLTYMIDPRIPREVPEAVRASVVHVCKNSEILASSLTQDHCNVLRSYGLLFCLTELYDSRFIVVGLVRTLSASIRLIYFDPMSKHQIPYHGLLRNLATALRRLGGFTVDDLCCVPKIADASHYVAYSHMTTHAIVLVIDEWLRRGLAADTNSTNAFISLPVHIDINKVAELKRTMAVWMQSLPFAAS